MQRVPVNIGIGIQSMDGETLTAQKSITRYTVSFISLFGMRGNGSPLFQVGFPDMTQSVCNPVPLETVEAQKDVKQTGQKVRYLAEGTEVGGLIPGYAPWEKNRPVWVSCSGGPLPCP